MIHTLHRVGKFYSRIIMKFIGIFIFIGLLAVSFGSNGWFPNESIYAISRFSYQYMLPLLIAYTGGGQMRRIGISEQERRQQTQELHAGGVIAVMMVAGVVSVNPGNGILAAMIVGPVSGLLWENVIAPGIDQHALLADMLIRNIVIALTGFILALVSVYSLIPFFQMCTNVAEHGITYLAEHNLICLSSMIIEPAKVFFLNNGISHGILVPLGLSQTEISGGSILFLLESNPGPGFGILLAYYLMSRGTARRKEYATGMFVQLIGGVHEVYFPAVLSNIVLLIPLIAGGTAGNLVFSMMKAQTVSAVTPGSILTMLMVTERTKVISVLLGVVVSAAVSLALAWMILLWQRNRQGQRQESGESGQDTGVTAKNAAGALSEQEEVNDRPETESMLEKHTADERSKRKGMNHIHQGKILKIGFVCDGGVGSSAMAAALFRRKLAEQEIRSIEVAAYARDQIPEDLDMVVCQKDLMKLVRMEEHHGCVFGMSSLLRQEEYGQLIDEIKKRNGDEDESDT